MSRRIHREIHHTKRIGWLRAAVLGANDGIVSTASLVVGVAAANAGRAELMLAGVAGMVAGAISMAAGEYVSVSSQADTEKADLAREAAELQAQPEHEHRELAEIYIKRGLEPELAEEVSRQLMAHDGLAAHARDELGINEVMSANPVQAAFVSALTFSIGAAQPILAALLSPMPIVIPMVASSSLVVLTVLGVVSARAGGAPVWRATSRVVFWGAFAMLVTDIVGRLFGTMGRI